jgi:hypothetical protein
MFTNSTVENVSLSSPVLSASSVIFGNNQLSLFKNKQTEDTGLITHSNQINISNNTSIDTTKIELIDDIKNEPVNFIVIDNNNKQDSNATFSDEEENHHSNINLAKSDETEYNNNEDTNDSENSNNIFNNNFEGNLNIIDPSSFASLTLLEQQLKKFSSKPLKIFSLIDETASNIKSNNLMMQSLENQLNLIPSDDLRNKLIHLNDKLTNNSTDNTNKISFMMKDILSCICRDPEFLNNFGSSLTDLAVSICLIFKNDFSNALLPLLFYSSNSSSENSKLVNNDIDFISINTFLTNPNYLSLINETINRRPIFLLFKELSLTANQSHEREILLQLLHEMYLKQNRIGYYFIYYIYYVYLNSIVSYSNSTALLSNSSISMLQQSEFLSLIRVYHEFIKERHNQQISSFDNIKSNISDDEASDGTKLKSKNVNYEPISSSSSSGSSQERSSSSLENSSDYSENENNEEISIEFTQHDLMIGNYLMQDIRLCQQDDSILFLFLISFLLNNNNNLIQSDYLINNSELIYLIVSSIDSKQLKDILVNIISQDLVLLRQPNLKNRYKPFISITSKNKKSHNINKEILNNIISKKRKRNDSENNKITSRQIVSNCKKGNISYRKENLGQVLKASLYWETIEQIFFWELLIAHTDIDLNYLLPIFNSLDTNRNSEAVGYLFKLIKQSEPTFDLVKYLLKRSVDDNVTRALFINWSKNVNSGPTKLSQIFVKILTKTSLYNQKQTITKKIKLNESFSSNTKKPTVEQQLENLNNTNKENINNLSLNDLLSNHDEYNCLPTLDQVLSHLNKLRLNNICLSFVLKESLLESLKKIYKKYSDEEMKKKYFDLFNLADESYKSNSSSNEDHDEEIRKNDDEDKINEKYEHEDDENESNNKNKRKKHTNYIKASTKRYNNKNKTVKINNSQTRESTSGKNKKVKRHYSDSENNSNLKLKKKNEKSTSDSNSEDSENTCYNTDESISSSNYSSSDEYSKALKQNLKKSTASNTKKLKSKSSTLQPPSKKLKKLTNSDNISD